jgi:ABC-type Fe3+/spermidine/putrescine transport system ATPase subunit
VVRGGEHGLAAIGGHRLALALSPVIAEGQAVQLAIRPENVRVSSLPADGAAGAGRVPAKVVEVTFLGNLTDCYVSLDDGTRVRVQADPGIALAVGQPVAVELDTRAATVFTA